MPPRSLTDCLNRLESQSDPASIQALRSVFEPLLIQGTKQVTELKAYEKILADAQKNARSDPNNEHWLEQVAQKTKRHDECLQNVNTLIDAAVRQIDSHTRQRTIAILLALADQGYLDKSTPNPNTDSAMSTSSKDTLSHSIALKAVEKTVDNERKEREQSLRSLKHDFESYRDFNNSRVKRIEDTHRQELNSLKEALRTAQSQAHAPPPAPHHETGQPIENIKSELFHQLSAQVTEHIGGLELGKSSLKALVDTLKDQLDQLGKDTTIALAELQPEIRRATGIIQTEVTKAARLVISEGHQEIAGLVRSTVDGLHCRVDKLEHAKRRPASPSVHSPPSSHTQPSILSPAPIWLGKLPNSVAQAAPPSSEPSHLNRSIYPPKPSIASRLTSAPTDPSVVSKKREPPSREPSWTVSQSHLRIPTEPRAPTSKPSLPLAKRLRTEENHDPSRSNYSQDWSVT